MLHYRTSPVTISGYRTLTDRQTGQPMSRRDGTVVEMVAYRDAEDERDRERVLDPSINGSRPDAGSVVYLDVQQRQEPVARSGRDGRPYVQWSEKEKVVGFAPVKQSA